MRYFLQMALVVTTISCDKLVDPNDNLDTSPKETYYTTWGRWDVVADISWKLNNAHRISDDQIRVAGSWTITFRNRSSQRGYHVDLDRFVFEDDKRQVVAQYGGNGRVVSRFTISPLSYNVREGNFIFSVESTKVANSIQRMDVYVSFESF